MIPRVAVDATLGRLETAVVTRLRLRNEYPPLFIVGAPRSGTTLVYQHVVNRFRFAFFPNLSRWYPRTCVAAAVIARRLPQRAAGYTSRFGDLEGATAPSDGWDVFHRWFPRYDYSVPIEHGRLHELRTIVRLLERIYGAPFVNKNNSNSVRIEPLAALFPEAMFVHVTRDLPATVDSVLRARREHGIPTTQWWGAPPPRFQRMSFADELERAVAQVWGLREQIAEDLAEVPESRRLVLDYERFCSAPGTLEEWIRSAYSARGIHLADRAADPPPGFSARRGGGAADPRFRERVREIAQRLESERLSGSEG